jgi:hypothetical protein
MERTDPKRRAVTSRCAMTRAKGILMVLSLLSLGVLLVLARFERYPKVQLPGGPTLKIEGLTYGIDHSIGLRVPLETWVPVRYLSGFLHLTPPSEMHFGNPKLMVWFTASDPVTGKLEDVPQLRVGILDDQGNVYPGECVCRTVSANGVYRAGFAFEAYPRSKRTLSLQLIREEGQMIQVRVANPAVCKPVRMHGKPLPQSKTVGELVLTLAGLERRFVGFGPSGATEHGWFWLPTWELTRAGQPAAGWDGPEWEAEDELGNRGQYLGTLQPALRLKASYYPSPTNVAEAHLLGALPVVPVEGLGSNRCSSVEIPWSGAKVKLVGVFGPGSNAFLEGQLVTAPVPGIPALPPSSVPGWNACGAVGANVFGQARYWWRHTSAVPAIYLFGCDRYRPERLAVRVRDDLGRVWTTTPEPAPQGQVCAWLMRLPPDAKTVSAELVLLKPLQAEFVAATPAAKSEGNR